MPNGTPHPVDVHVGARIRMRRVELRLSQEKVGAALGLTFQQLQKYEKGVNRVSCSRLVGIAQVLAVAPSYFLEGAPGATNGPASLDPMARLLSTRGGASLARSYMQMQPPVAQAFVMLAESIAGESFAIPVAAE